MFGNNELIVRADVRIVGIDPAVYRLLELPYDATLDDLHYLFQASFGWKDTHLHQFLVGGLSFGPPDAEDDHTHHRTFNSQEVRLRDFRLSFSRPLELYYEYDFGDRWLHTIDLRIAEREPDVRYPRCVGGARAGPLEDSGGPHGYVELVTAWNDPMHPKHGEFREWAPARFDPERFDALLVTKAMQAAYRRTRK